MSEITDLGSPDRELSAGDIRRKTNKLNRINTRLENTSAGTRRRHNLEFKKEKTIDQITTGKSGIRPTKKPFKVTHQYDLKQEEKYNMKKSPLNIIGIKSITDNVKNVVSQQKDIDTHWKGEEKAYAGKKDKHELNTAYVVKGLSGLKTKYNAPEYDNEPNKKAVHTYKNWKK